MKILLLLAPVLNQNLCPIGLAYLSSYIKEHSDFEIEIWNLNLELPAVKENDIDYWLNAENAAEFISSNDDVFGSWMDRISEYSPDIVGFSVWNTAKHASLHIAKKIKETNPNTLIVFGGYDCSIKGKQYISLPQVDVAVMGEGEETFLEIAQKYNKNREIDFCKGAFVKSGNKIIDGGPREEIEDLDLLPYPDFSDFKDLTSIPLAFNRGCKNRCKYCHISVHMKKFRKRSPDKIIDEIKYQKKLFPNLKLIHQGDVSKIQDLEVLSDVCDKIIAENLNVSWEDWASMDPELDVTLLKKMKLAGCKYVCYGIESGSQKILDLMGKKITIAQAKKLIHDTYNAGITVAINIIVGFPGETEEDFYQTADFIRDTIKYIDGVISISACRILDQSFLYKNPEKYGLILDDNLDANTWYTEKGDNTFEIRAKRVEYLKKIVEDDAKERECIKQSKIYFKQSDTSSAIKVLKEFLDIYPDSLAAHIELAKLYELNQDLTSSINVLKKIISMGSNDKKIFLQLARCYMGNKEYLNAVTTLETPVLSASQDTIVSLYLGKSYIELKNYEKAKNILKAAINSKESGAEINLELANICEIEHDFDKAIEYIKVALNKESSEIDDNKMYLYLARCYMEKKDYLSSIEVLEDLPLLTGSDETASLYLCKSYINLKKYDKAKNILLSAIESGYTSAEINSELANISEIQGNFTEAIKYIKSAIKNGYSKSEAYLKIARWYMDQQQYSHASKYLEKASLVFENADILHFYFGRCALGLGNLEDAEKEFKMALSIEPDNSEIRLELARIYEQKDEPKKSIIELKQIIESGSSDPDIHKYLARLYSDSNEHELAQAELAIAADLKEQSNI